MGVTELIRDCIRAKMKRRLSTTGPLLLLVAAAGYLGFTEYGLWLNQPVNLGAGFWPAAGFSLKPPDCNGPDELGGPTDDSIRRVGDLRGLAHPRTRLANAGVQSARRAPDRQRSAPDHQPRGPSTPVARHRSTRTRSSEPLWHRTVGDRLRRTPGLLPAPRRDRLPPGRRDRRSLPRAPGRDHRHRHGVPEHTSARTSSSPSTSSRASWSWRRQAGPSDSRVSPPPCGDVMIPLAGSCHHHTSLRDW